MLIEDLLTNIPADIQRFLGHDPKFNLPTQPIRENSSKLLAEGENIIKRTEPNLQNIIRSQLTHTFTNYIS